MTADIGESQAYVDHLQSEHRRLHQRILEVQHALAQSQTGLNAELTALQDELAQHFAEEDAGGCMEEAMARCPAVAERCRALCAEHSVLLREMSALIDEYHAEAQRRARWGDDFHQLTERLFQHEREENEILQRAFGVGYG
jgi:hypothetical protein